MNLSHGKCQVVIWHFRSFTMMISCWTLRLPFFLDPADSQAVKTAFVLYRACAVPKQQGIFRFAYSRIAVSRLGVIFDDIRL